MRWLENNGYLPHHHKISNFLVAALFLSFWISGTIQAQAAYPLSNQEIETLVEIGEYRLNFQVIKGGSLTILLEAVKRWEMMEGWK